jgi:hypothetical protein
MKPFMLLLFVVAGVSVCASQVPSPDPTPDSATEELLIGCAPQDNQPTPLVLDSLSAKGLTLTNLAPVGDQPFNYVLVYDRRKPALARGGKDELILSRLLLHTLTRTGKDSGSVVFFDSGVQAARGSTTNADDILAVAEKIQPGDNGFALFDALRVGIEKLDEMRLAGPRFIFLVSMGTPGSSIYQLQHKPDAWNNDQAKVEDLLISSRTLLIAVTMNAMSDFNSSGMIKLGLVPYYSVIRDMTNHSGGWVLQTQSEPSEAKIVKNYGKDFDNLATLFQNWYWLRVQPSFRSNGELAFTLKTKEHCNLVAPGRLIISPKKPQ